MRHCQLSTCMQIGSLPRILLARAFISFLFWGLLLSMATAQETPDLRPRHRHPRKRNRLSTTRCGHTV